MEASLIKPSCLSLSSTSPKPLDYQCHIIVLVPGLIANIIKQSECQAQVRLNMSKTLHRDMGAISLLHVVENIRGLLTACFVVREVVHAGRTTPRCAAWVRWSELAQSQAFLWRSRGCGGLSTIVRSRVLMLSVAFLQTSAIRTCCAPSALVQASTGGADIL
jgi:hypothetical protein